jgi:hypothetical protein
LTGDRNPETARPERNRTGEGINIWETRVPRSDLLALAPNPAVICTTEVPGRIQPALPVCCWEIPAVGNGGFIFALALGHRFIARILIS